MEITLEKIELVKDRTGVSYKDAKEALEKTEGNVVEAIILIEDTIDTAPAEETPSRTSAILTNIKELVHKGNVSRVLISKEGETIINLPVSIGIAGAIIFPWAVLGSAITAFGTKCRIELVKTDGSTVDVSERAGAAFDKAKDKGGVIVDEVKDRSGDLFEKAKVKGADIFEVAKDKGGDLFEKAKDKGADFFEVAKDKGADVFASVKEKTVSLKEKADRGVELGDFDLSDLDLDELDSTENDD